MKGTRTFDLEQKWDFLAKVDGGKRQVEFFHEMIRLWTKEYEDLAPSGLTNSAKNYYDKLNETLYKSQTDMQNLYDAANQVEDYYAGKFGDIAFSMGMYIDRINTLLGVLQAPGSAGNVFDVDTAVFSKRLEGVEVEIMNAEVVAIYEYYSQDGKWKGLLEKPANEILDSEYAALAMIYLELDEEGLTEFLKLASIKVKEYDYSGGMSALLGYARIHNVPDKYSEWEPDYDKLSKIECYLQSFDSQLVYQQMYIKKLNSNDLFELGISEEYREEYLNTMEAQQKNLEQRLSLLRVYSSLEVLNGEMDASVPCINIVLASDNSGNYILEYCNTIYTFEIEGVTRYNHLSPVSFTISKTNTGTQVIDEIAKANNTYYNNKYGYDIGTVFGEQTLKLLSEKAVEKLLKSYEKKGLPILGDIVFIGLDVLEEITENQGNLADTQASYNLNLEGSYCNKFLLNATLVQKNDNIRDASVLIYPSRNTQFIIDKFNKELAKEDKSITVTIEQKDGSTIDITFDGIDHQDGIATYVDIDMVLFNQDLVNAMIEIFKNRDDGAYGRIFEDIKIDGLQIDGL